MIALTRYTFATMLHSQRYVAPVLLFMGIVGVLASNDNGPVAPVYASSAAALFVCSTWLTIALLSVEDPTHRMITVVTAAGRAGCCWPRSPLPCSVARYSGSQVCCCH
jgi:hypothetical protein